MRPTLALLLALTLPAFGEAPEPLPTGASLDIVIQQVWGDVDCQADAKSKWLSAERGVKLPPGARLATGTNSQVLLTLGTNCVVLIEETSRLRIDKFEVEKRDVIGRLFLDPGEVICLVRQLPSFYTDLVVQSPRLTASVRSGLPVVPDGDEDPQKMLEEAKKEESAREAAERKRFCSYFAYVVRGPFDTGKVPVEWEANRFIADVFAGKADGIRGDMAYLMEQLSRRSPTFDSRRSPTFDWKLWRRAGHVLRLAQLTHRANTHMIAHMRGGAA